MAKGPVDDIKTFWFCKGLTVSLLFLLLTYSSALEAIILFSFARRYYYTQYHINNHNKELLHMCPIPDLYRAIPPESIQATKIYRFCDRSPRRRRILFDQPGTCRADSYNNRTLIPGFYLVNIAIHF